MRSLAALGLCLCAAVAVTAADARATTVRFTSNMGTFDVELTDSITPITVANFLSFVNAGAYNNTIVHRSIPGFVIQGGGFRNDISLPPIPTGAPIANEIYQTLLANGGGPVNIRGTIAMAHGSSRDGATSQWFINLVDNSANLDYQAGGYAVFGRVIGSGMDTVDAIAALPRYFVNGPISDLPLAGDGSPVTDNLVSFSSVSVVPEPAALGAAIVGLACVAGRRPRRRV